MRAICFRFRVAALTFILGCSADQLILLARHITPHKNDVAVSASILEIHSDKLWPETESLTLEGDDTKTFLFNGYTLKRFFKTITFDETVQGSVRDRVKVSYARLMRGGKTIATFDAHYQHPLGNETTYGSVSLLGRGTQQLAICQSAWRSGDYWIVTADPTPQVIFYTGDWSVRGDSLQEIDIDGDGIDELVLHSWALYDLQDKLSISELPSPELVFKYDKNSNKYLPANSAYSEYLQRGIDTIIKHVKSSAPSDFNHRPDVLRITLTLIYANREDTAWAFYDSTYKLPDKEEIRARVKAAIKLDPYYQALVSERSTIRKVDFENFRYADTTKVTPDQSSFDLKNGTYNPPPVDPYGEWPANHSETVSLVYVAYGDVTSDANEEAIVVLTQDITGTAIPYWFYVFTIVDRKPKMIWNFSAGDRAQGGLKRVYAERGDLIVEVFGPGRDGQGYFRDDAAGACCALSFTRTRYRWSDGFVESGSPDHLPLGIPQI